MISEAELAQMNTRLDEIKMRGWPGTGLSLGEQRSLLREVEELRAEATRHADERDGLAIVNKQANERIEVLRAALREMLENVKHNRNIAAYQGVFLGATIKRARAALGEKP